MNNDKKKELLESFKEKYDKLIDKHTVAYTKTGDKDFNPPEVVSFDTRVINNYELGQELEQFISKVYDEAFEEGYLTSKLVEDIRDDLPMNKLKEE